MLSADPVFQELRGRGLAGRGMLPSPVVERFDVVEQANLRRVPRTIADAKHPLILQAVEETLRGLIWLRPREVPRQQVRRYRQDMLGIGRRLEAPCAVPGYRSAASVVRRVRESSVAQFAHSAWRSAGVLQFLVDGLDQCQYLRICQPCPNRTATTLPGSGIRSCCLARLHPL